MVEDVIDFDMYIGFFVVVMDCEFDVSFFLGFFVGKVILFVLWFGERCV